jgi:membrane fusion protein, heavy metal efflux system
MAMSLPNKKILIIAGIIAVVMFTSCSGNNSAEVKTSVQDSAATEEHTDEEGLEVTEEQMNAVGIQLGTVELKNLSEVVKASGQLAVPPQRQADVNVLTGGIVRRIYPLEGQWVKKGQPLVTIENTELAEMQEEYITAKNSFSYTAAELQRQKELDEAEAGTKKKLQEAQARYNTETAQINALEQRLRQFGINPASVSKGNITTQINVYAPISGTVGHISVNTGTYAQPGNALMEIIDNSQIHCDLVVYEKDLFRVKAGQRVSFMLTNQNNREIVGRIYGVNKSFEDESKGIIVHAVIENANTFGLIPGMYVTALISVGSAKLPAVPVDAVVRSEGKDYIFVVEEEPETHEEEKPDNAEHKETEEGHEHGIHFKMMEVATGVSELGYIHITFLEKVPENPKLVVKGANYLLSKSKGPASHDH